MNGSALLQDTQKANGHRTTKKSAYIRIGYAYLAMLKTSILVIARVIPIALLFFECKRIYEKKRRRRETNGH